VTVLVIDASAAVRASLPSDGFDLLDGEELVAPALLWSEVPSVLHEMAWRGTVSRGLGREALERFLTAPIGTRRHARLGPEALAHRGRARLGHDVRRGVRRAGPPARLPPSHARCPSPADGVAPRRGTRPHRAVTAPEEAGAAPRAVPGGEVGAAGRPAVRLPGLSEKHAVTPPFERRL
jgi:hypothetical protein